MTTKHTPGPWVHEQSVLPSTVFVSACDQQVTIYTAPLTNETEANARLIAAAPDLLAACEAFVGARLRDIDAAERLALAAIAKARGGA